MTLDIHFILLMIARLVMAIVIGILIYKFISCQVKKSSESVENDPEKLNENLMKSRNKNIILGIVFGIDLITVLPSPIFFAASMMSAAGGPRINFSDPREMVIRFFWVCLAYYPVFILVPFIIGWIQLNKNDSIKGYVFTILSGVISMGLTISLIIFFVFGIH